MDPDREARTIRAGHSSQAETSAPSDRVRYSIVLPNPTTDQQDYLDEIARATGHFDPNVVIGGPRSGTPGR